MTDSRWQRVEALFHEARALPVEQRTAFLSQVCAGDDVMLRAVLRMVDATSAADALFENPAGLASLIDPPLQPEVDPILGAMLGVWRIDRVLAAGGMGAVYLAHRADDQFHKKAAAKLLRHGFHSEHLRRRFLAERQILAGLEHPNIARLLDGGLSGDGMPYLIMEFVEGQPLDAYCNSRNLGVRARLEIFRHVFSAVSYAHHNMVIHRDLKPSNIMVTTNGGVKLLDFGIAKLIDEPADGELTSTTSVMMTPRYASPEQALGKMVNAQSDVYSLGVVLFESLCGRSPYATTQRTVAEWFLAIQNEECPPPSQAAQSPALRNELRGDLDLIVAKALRKDALERYASVEQFDADVQAYLEGRPVTARPQTAAYRVGKFVRRHRAGVLASAAAILLLIAGLLSTLWEAHVAERERLRAEKRFQQVRELARLSLFDLFDIVKDMPGSTTAQQLLITKSLANYEKLAREATGDPELLGELAEAYSRLGNLYGNPYSTNIGETQKALATYRRGLELLGGIPEGAGPKALEKSRALLYSSLGEVTAYSGDTPKGIEYMRRCIRLLEVLETRDPTAADILVELSGARGTLGDHLAGIGTGIVLDKDGAIGAFQSQLVTVEALSKRTDIPPEVLTRARRGVSIACMKLGQCMQDFGRAEEALPWYRRSLEALDRMDAAENSSLANMRIRTTLIRGQSATLMSLGRPKEAVDVLSPAIETLRSLYQRDPQNRQFGYGLVTFLKARGDSHQQAGNTAAALDDYREAERRAALQVEEDPANAVIKGRLDDLRKLVAELAAPGN
ncbi:serine/threonine-protein kinase [uncultured Paludibaculum sp.]|uniref:serine/threonine-protein kinase n=1 Tax=uncultured Paludibaculum sp. TaxID=1765020 RepID=UPI002AAAB84F|nr:serine/threonine-protein kinase [uncultured Paludibaculum sp.]